MSNSPRAIKLSGPGRLRIEWSEGQVREYTFRELRDNCPCATCREKHNVPAAAPNPFTVLSPAEARPVEVLGMKPVGNYAYAIAFSDGHDTGIYTFEHLLRLGDEVPPSP